MGPEEPHVGRRLAAIFAADVVGYSRLMGQDEAGTLRALSAARATLGQLIAEHGGRLVNTVGDSALAEFPSAVDAVKCAIAVQQKLAAEVAEVLRLQFRIAVHVGDVLAGGSEIYGDGVNVCARLQEIAPPGGVCLSGAAYQYVRKALPFSFDDLGEKTLKNIDEAVRVFAIRAPQTVGHSPPQSKRAIVPNAPHAKRPTLGWIAGGIAAVLAIVLVYEFAPTGVTTTGQAGSISLAVLPFANLSGDPSQEFFSDGMTEEITSALAKIPDLHVVGRTSAFQFKGQNRDLRAIGQALSVTHLIEGSVRKAGDRLRITAQLIEVADGTHVWAENYDRQLTDVFAIQADVATAIAGALRTPLSLKLGERLVSDRSIDPESYEQYLRAKGLIRNRNDTTPLTAATELLEQVVARTPNYAPAWAQLAIAYGFSPISHPARFNSSVEEMRRVVGSFFTRAEEAAQRAVQLEPNLADGYAALARIHVWSGEPLQAEELYLKALALDPKNPDTIGFYSNLLGGVGRLKEALAMRQQALAIEPYVPSYHRNTALFLWLNGQTDEAIAMIMRSPPGAARAWHVAAFYTSAGRYDEAANILLQIPAGFYPDGAVEEAVRLLRTVRSPPTFSTPRKPFTTLDFVYLYVGAPERVLDFYERNAEVGYTAANDISILWHPSAAPVRKTERFKALVRKIGYVDYWRAKGWPEFCRLVGADDFVCE